MKTVDFAVRELHSKELLLIEGGTVPPTNPFNLIAAASIIFRAGYGLVIDFFIRRKVL